MLAEFDINGLLRKVQSFSLASKRFDMLSHPQNLVFANDFFY